MSSTRARDQRVARRAKKQEQEEKNLKKRTNKRARENEVEQELPAKKKAKISKKLSKKKKTKKAKKKSKKPASFTFQQTCIRCLGHKEFETNEFIYCKECGVACHHWCLGFSDCVSGWYCPSCSQINRPREAKRPINMLPSDFKHITYPHMLEGDSKYDDSEYKEEKQQCNQWKLQQFQNYILKCKDAESTSAIILDASHMRESTELVTIGVLGANITAVQYGTDDLLCQQEFMKQCRDFSLFYQPKKQTAKQQLELVRDKQINYELSRVNVIPGSLKFYLEQLAGPRGICPYVKDDYASFDYFCTAIPKDICAPLAEIQTWFQLKRPADRCSMFVTFCYRMAPLKADAMCLYIVERVTIWAKEAGYKLLKTKVRKLRKVYVISLPLVKC